MADVSDEIATKVDEDATDKTAAAKKKSDHAAKEAVADHGVGLLHR